MTPLLQLRPLERSDLEFAHMLTNDAKIMRYWFEEPYETLSELTELYDRHIQDQRERRFVCQNEDGELVGLVELMELNYIHRSGEFQIIIAPRWQGKGYAKTATRRAIDYAFRVLNLNKVYLVVDRENTHAIRLYEQCGFKQEGLLIEEFFSDGAYRDALRMFILQRDHLAAQARTPKPAMHHNDSDAPANETDMAIQACHQAKP